MLKFYSPLTGDFYKNDVDEYGWNNGVADYPTLFSGVDMVYYEDRIRDAIDQRNSADGGNLMLYFDERRNHEVKAKILSAIPSVEIRNGELTGCTTVRLEAPLTETEMEDLQDYLKGQFSDGWGEGFEQQAIQISNGVLNVHFWNAEHFAFEVVSVQSEESVKKAAGSQASNDEADRRRREYLRDPRTGIPSAAGKRSAGTGKRDDKSCLPFRRLLQCPQHYQRICANRIVGEKSDKTEKALRQGAITKQ